MAKSKSKGKADKTTRKAGGPPWASKKKAIQSVARDIGKLQKQLQVLAAKLEKIASTAPGGGGNPKT